MRVGVCEDKVWAAELFEKLVGCWGRTNCLPAVTQLSLEKQYIRSLMPVCRGLAFSKYPFFFLNIQCPLHLVTKLKLYSNYTNKLNFYFRSRRCHF